MFLSVAIPFVSFCCYFKLQSLKYKMALLIFLQGSFWAMALGCVATPILHRLNLVEITDGRFELVGGQNLTIRRWSVVGAGVVPGADGGGIHLPGKVSCQPQKLPP